MKNTFAVFSGGGVKAAAFVGAIREATKHITFSGVGGASAGAIAASLLACGYTHEELENELFNAPYPEIFKSYHFNFILDQRRGLCKPIALRNWIRSCINKKVKPTAGQTVTFSQLIQNGAKIPLKIVATNLTTREIKIYSAVDTPNEDVAQAVLASCSFPLIFPPVKHGDHDLVDGGVMSNFPMWLFDDERKGTTETIPVLGFLLTTQSYGTVEKPETPNYLYTIFDAIMVAQDRVQEKFLDIGRLADVIRISIPQTTTFDKKQSGEDRIRLMDVGRLAAIDYFENAPSTIQERVLSPLADAPAQAKRQLQDGNATAALSTIIRQHILRGGVAKDQGVGDGRTFVRYYIDLMEASTNRERVETLAEILISKMPPEFSRIIGIKKGNILLAAHVAYKTNKPLTLVKADFSFKMGYPFDGEIRRNEQVVLVDDIASDASMLLHAIRQLTMHHVQVISVVTLLERTEGDARFKIAEANCRLRSVCLAGDLEIQQLIDRGQPLPSATEH